MAPAKIPPSLLRDVADAVQLLLKHAKNPGDNLQRVQDCLAILNGIDAAYISLDFLKKTGAAKAVKRCSKSSNGLVKQAGVKLEKTWRSVLSGKQVVKSEPQPIKTETQTEKPKAEESQGTPVKREVNERETKSVKPEFVFNDYCKTLDNLRKRYQELFFKNLKAPPTSELMREFASIWPADVELADLAISIEEALYRKFSRDSATLTRKAQMISRGLKRTEELRCQVALRRVSPQQLSEFKARDFSGEAMRKKRAELDRQESAARRSNYKQAMAGEMQKELGISNAKSMYTCPKCKSRRISHFAMQTRSADEPMTIFCTCLECGKAFRR